MSFFNTMIRISCISFVAIIAILKNFITLNAISETEFLAITVATHDNDALLRYKKSAESFNIPYEIFGIGEKWSGGDIKNKPGGGQKVKILQKSLNKYKDMHNMILMFTDSYDVVFQNNTESLINKFRKMEAKVVFSAEGFCWPDVKLEKSYPAVSETEKRFLNSGGFIGYASEIYKIVNQAAIKDEDDDQLYYTHIFLNESLRSEYQMKLDTKSEIFQNLNGAIGEVIVSHEKGVGYVKNVISNSVSVVVHANGPTKIYFNSLTNYIGHSWSPVEGCQHCKINAIDLSIKKLHEYPKITVALTIIQPTPFIDEYFSRVQLLSYPPKQLDVIIHCIKHHMSQCQRFIVTNKDRYASISLSASSSSTTENIHESGVRNGLLAAAHALTDNEFLFVLDSVVQLSNQETLQRLVTRNHSIVAPMVSRRGRLWTNFWGALNREGYYQRSEDYLEIVQNVKRGLWNVPLVNAVYLVRRDAIGELLGAYGPHNNDEEADMNFCYYAREKNIFMWVDNEEDYGHQVLVDNYTTTHLYNDLWEIFTNPLDWQEKYIHPKYWEAASDEKMMSDIEQPCPDVFWFPFVSDTFCSQLIDEMENFGEWSDGNNKDKRLEGGYENVPTRDIHMRQVNWEEHWLHILRTYIYPMQRKLFAGYEDMPTARMNFVVRYRPDEQPTLRPHHDASSYSLNLALNLPGVNFQGGGTRFIRYDCEVRQSRLGWVLMHPGRVTHLHEGLRTTNGTRYIFVTFINP